MPELTLTLHRHIAAPPAIVWRLWTEPHLLMQWFAPRPTKTVEAVLDVQPGGRFYTSMLLPDGSEHASEGCFLLTEPGRRLVFTDCLLAGFRPAPKPFFTADISLAAVPGGTDYLVRALHANEATARRHAEMGFEAGWGAATDQLAALAATL
ncbi:MAG: SRPBCC family protein [Phaeovulum sp.]|uniref:SRPBCC family protein n=1 Tax=Phaeovulum sp. TaxID=2934796 RepID=UPI00273138D8|nr:SRPBCC family protein [Phaeovulum sp.]MDP2062453.1 SRPBCC family protein [Phaeovulum sp.]